MIGLLGASGLIGWNLYKFLLTKQETVLGTYLSQKKEGLIKFDLEKDDFSLFDGCKQVIILGAITNIDECYLKKDLVYKINVERTIELISYLADRDIKPVFISSDQVFDGKKGNYTEEDEPNPVNYYGRFKLIVEEFTRVHLKDYLILRLSKTYSRNLDDPGMFREIFVKLKKSEKLKAAYNQIFNPTDIRFICEGFYRAIKMDLKGLYHLAEQKIMSRYDFALSIAEEYGFDKNLIERIDFNTLGVIEKRALNSSLNVEKIYQKLNLIAV